MCNQNRRRQKALMYPINLTGQSKTKMKLVDNLGGWIKWAKRYIGNVSKHIWLWNASVHLFKGCGSIQNWNYNYRLIITICMKIRFLLNWIILSFLCLISRFVATIGQLSIILIECSSFVYCQYKTDVIYQFFLGSCRSKIEEKSFGTENTASCYYQLSCRSYRTEYLMYN